MDLGSLGNYPLPRAIQTAYGADTAQQLADQLGVTKPPTADMASEADAAYRALKQGDQSRARSLLVDKLGVSEDNADAALAKLPPL
ncbi:MAG: hypothetical protein JWQ43_1478 [Glaciihabitans sp.]|nr:hypothetical protein [Glaciihabitans sp.]